MKEIKVKLDRVRIMRLTPYSIVRAEKEFGGIVKLGERLQKAPKDDDIARAFWVFLVDDDPMLTPADVKSILEKFLSTGWRWLKERRVMRMVSQIQGLMIDVAASLSGEN